MQQNTTTATEVTLAVNAIVLAYVLYRQVIARPVRTDRNLVSALLIVVGAIDFVNFLSSNHVSAGGLILVLSGLVVLGIGFGAVRAYTVRLWRNDDGLVYRQGTWATIVLWFVSIALHSFLDILSGTHSTSIYLYFGVTLTVQRLVVGYRAGKMLSSSGQRQK